MKKIALVLSLLASLSAKAQFSSGRNRQHFPPSSSDSLKMVWICKLKGDTILVPTEFKYINFIRLGDKTYEIVRPAPFLQEAKAPDSSSFIFPFQLWQPGREKGQPLINIQPTL